MSSSDKLILARLDELTRLIEGLARSHWVTMEETSKYLCCSKRKIGQHIASRLPVAGFVREIGL